MAAHRPSTVPTLRYEAMRRRSSRRGALALPDAVSTSVGSTSGSAEAGGTSVWRVGSLMGAAVTATAVMLRFDDA